MSHTEPDAKRPRPDSYHQGPLPPPPPPRPHPYPDHSPHPHTPLPPPSSHGPPPNQHDSRALPDPASRGIPPTRSGYATPVTQSRPQLNEGHFTHTPPTPSQPGSAVDPYPRPTPPIAAQEPRRDSMDADHHYAAYHPPEQQVNGHVHHGLPPPHHHDGPMGHPYGPHPPQYDLNIQYGYRTQKKAVRAQQACEECRKKKSKCSEERPACNNCVTAGISCTYREVQPPKQERSLQQLTQAIDTTKNISELTKDDTTHLRTVLDAIRFEMKAQFDELRSQVSPRTPGDVTQKSFGQYEERKPQIDQMQLSPSTGPADESERPRADSQGGQQGDDMPNDVLKGELSIPWEHTTAAHKLLSSWESIKPFIRNVTDENYVMSNESHRGLLNLYGRFPIHVRSRDGYHYMNSPPMYAEHDDISTLSSSSTDVHHGSGFRSPVGADARPRVSYNFGGMNPDETLRMDPPTARDLFDSYKRHIHLLHPFLDITHMAQIIEQNMSSPTNVTSDQGYSTFAIPAHPIGLDSNQEPYGYHRHGVKRKRSAGSSPAPGGMPPSPELTPSERISTDRTIETAIMLLVFALGKICDHKDALPKPRGDRDTSSRRSNGSSSQPNSHFPSPATNHHSPHHDSNVRRSNSVPQQDPERTISGKMSRTSSADAHPTSEPRESFQTIRNIDFIPGLAYYARAAQILGEQSGGHELLHVQAKILAGLFMGQLVRAFESWQWIHAAGTQMQVLLKRDPAYMRFEPATSTEVDRIRLTYWTVLQLESDLLAELDLPHSGVSRLEDQIYLPQGTIIDPQDEVALLYYYAQIHVRKLLNRAHSALYNIRDSRKPPSGWAKLSAEDLSNGLENWRKKLPEPLRWDDSDGLAQDINAARLRGKYYGARYIIHRPFLHHVLSTIEKIQMASSQGQQPPTQIRNIQSSSSSNSPGLTGAISRESNLDLPLEHLRQLEGHYGLSREIIARAKICVDAAMKSTWCFDGVQGVHKRLIITNVFGTAHAQFGNMLVLAAVHRNPVLSWMVPRHSFDRLMSRTINLFKSHSHLSPTMEVDLHILENTKQIISSDSHPVSANTSFTN